MQLEVGSVIRLRHRLWRVDRVTDQDFTATPIDGRDIRRWRFLRSFEEQLAEPGALPAPDPQVLSDPAKQDLLLRAYRLNLIHGSAPFLGLQRSRAIPEPYQLVPLLMSLNMERVRLLIGDDVGVGKSVEAGLIISELFARGLAERLLVVVPAALREQWVETLDRFFHLDAVIMAGHTRPSLERRLLPGQSPWAAYPIVVASIDYLKRRVSEVLSHQWDAVLVDEAHIAARPHAYTGTSRVDKERWELLHALGTRETVKHLILLSATPHPGHTDCFASLLEVLNPEAVTGAGINREVAKAHVVQRRRLDIQEWWGVEAPFPERTPRDEVIPLSPPEAALLLGLREYGGILARTEGGNVGQWISLHLQRRALSSPRAITRSIEMRKKAARKRPEREAKKRNEGLAEAASAVLDQDSTTDLSDEHRWGRLDTAALLGTLEELEKLEELAVLAKKVVSESQSARASASPTPNTAASDGPDGSAGDSEADDAAGASISAEAEAPPQHPTADDAAGDKTEPTSRAAVEATDGAGSTEDAHSSPPTESDLFRVGLEIMEAQSCQKAAPLFPVARKLCKPLATLRAAIAAVSAAGDGEPDVEVAYRAFLQEMDLSQDGAADFHKRLLKTLADLIKQTVHTATVSDGPSCPPEIA